MEYGCSTVGSFRKKLKIKKQVQVRLQVMLENNTLAEVPIYPSPGGEGGCGTLLVLVVETRDA